MQRLCGIFLIFQMTSCAGAPIKVQTLPRELPADLPQEMRERFEIKEVAGHSLQVHSESVVNFPAQSPVAKKAHKKKKAKRQGFKAQSTASGDQGITPSSVSESGVDTVENSMIPRRRPVEDPIWVGEKLTYNISYLGIVAGSAELEVLPDKIMDGRRVLHALGHAVSTPLFSLVYRLDDTIESFMDWDGSFSHRFHLILDDKKQHRDSIELYDSKKQQTFFWSRWEYPDHSKKEIKETHDIPALVQDTLSSLFYLRTVPLEVGGVVTFPMVSEGKTSEVVCHVLRKESYRSPLGQATAIVVRPDVKFDGILKKTGDSFIWYSDDARRFPLRMEARVRVGTVVADLTKIELGTAPNRMDPSVQH